MKLEWNKAAAVLAAAGMMAFASTASAQGAGQWTVKAGINKITPKVESGDVSAPALPGTKADVDSDTKPIFVIAYGLTDNVSLELDLGLPYKHTLYGAGAIEGTGKIATVEVLPPTLFAQYRFFEPTARVRPYVGLGLTVVYNQKETGSGQLTAITNAGTGEPTTFEVKNKVTGTLQLGTAIAINERWYADLGVTKTYLKTKVNFSSGQYQDIKLDPVGVNIGIGYKF